MRTFSTVIVAALGFAVAACGQDAPTAPSLPPSGSASGAPAPQPPPPVTIRAFKDPLTGLSTSDVHEAQEQIIRLNSAGELIWVGDGKTYQSPLTGNMKGCFSVLFGTKDGTRRAYLTLSFDCYHYAPPAVVADLEVVAGELKLIDDRPPVALPESGAVLFTDPVSGYSTNDVFDAQEHVVRFSGTELLWAADGTRFPEFFPDGNLIGCHHQKDYCLQVRFGTKNGRRAAYITWTDDGYRVRGAPVTVIDVDVVDGRLVLVDSTPPVPLPEG
jgi:hypothetical protein